MAADIQDDLDKAIAESKRRGMGKANSFKDKKGKLPWILSQVPIRGLAVMSLQEFLETI
jgi:hypothetical protein